MKKELMFSKLCCVAALLISAECAADASPDAPPAESVAAQAAAAAPGAAPAQAPAAATVLPAPVSAPPVEDARPARAKSTKPTAVVLHSVGLRTRPVATATGDIIQAETRVRLEASTTNADGTWWFVTAPGIGGGWLLESEVGSPQRD